MSESNQVALTKNELRKTLEILLDEMPFTDIKIADVLQRSGVSRTTFYRHYHDTRDLLLDCFCTHIIVNPYEHLDAPFDDHAAQSRYTTLGIERIRKHPNLFKAVVERTDPVFLEQYRQRVTIPNQSRMKLMLEALDIDEKTCWLSISDLTELLDLSIIKVYLKWIDGGMIESDEDIARITYNICVGFSRALDRRVLPS